MNNISLPRGSASRVSCCRGSRKLNFMVTKILESEGPEPDWFVNLLSSPQPIRWFFEGDERAMKDGHSNTDLAFVDSKQSEQPEHWGEPVIAQFR